MVIGKEFGFIHAELECLSFKWMSSETTRKAGLVPSKEIWAGDTFGIKDTWVVTAAEGEMRLADKEYKMRRGLSKIMECTSF